MTYAIVKKVTFEYFEDLICKTKESGQEGICVDVDGTHRYHTAPYFLTTEGPTFVTFIKNIISLHVLPIPD